MSAVWTYFSISEKDPRTAIYKTCNAETSRGAASAKTFSTSGLIYHLKSKHSDRYAEYERNAAQKRKTQIKEIKQRAREMIQARDGCGEPAWRRRWSSAREGAQSAEKKTCLSAPDEGHAPSLSFMFSEILQESASNNR